MIKLVERLAPASSTVDLRAATLLWGTANALQNASNSKIKEIKVWGRGRPDLLSPKDLHVGTHTKPASKRMECPGTHGPAMALPPSPWHRGTPSDPPSWTEETSVGPFLPYRLTPRNMQLAGCLLLWKGGTSWGDTANHLSLRAFLAWSTVKTFLSEKIFTVAPLCFSQVF